MSAALFSAACASAPADDEQGSADEGELKKKVGSKTTAYAKVSVPGPAWFDPSRFENTVQVGDQEIRPGYSREFPPGAYSLGLVSHAHLYAPEFKLPGLQLAAGQTLTLDAPSGVHIARDGVLTWDGNASVATALYKDGALVAADSGLQMDGTDAMVRGRDFLVPSGNLTLRMGDTTTTIPVAPGELARVKVPVAEAEVTFESIDPAFPSPSLGGNDFFVADASGNHVEFLRKFGKRVVRPGVDVTLHNAWGQTTKARAFPGQPVSLAVHRLEIEALKVTKNGKTAETLTGVVIEVKEPNGTYKKLGHNLYAPMGADVLDGEYRVTRTAPYDGSIGDVETVSFP